MKASTRRWVSLSALSLLALDLGAFAVAVPHARGWLESARTSSLVRAGSAAMRNLEQAGACGTEDAGLALLTRFTRRSASAYGLLLRATPSGPVLARRLVRPQVARLVELETLAVPDVPAVPAASEVPSSCPLSTCPRCPLRGPARATTAGSSTIGLPASALKVTIE